MASLSIQNLSKTLADGGRSFELVIPSLSLAPGDRKAIIGRTGSGKSTAMDLIALASLPDRCDGFTIMEADGTLVDVYGPRPARAEARLAALRARHFGYVTQSSPLLPFLDVLDNVILQQKLSRRTDPELARDLLEAVGLKEELHASPRDLSVGQRQRAAIARALAHRPNFLLCDEPTGSLDGETARNCLEIMVEVSMAVGAAMLMITHDEALAGSFGFLPLPVMREEIAGGRSRAVLAGLPVRRREMA